MGRELERETIKFDGILKASSYAPLCICNVEPQRGGRKGGGWEERGVGIEEGWAKDQVISVSEH